MSIVNIDVGPESTTFVVGADEQGDGSGEFTVPCGPVALRRRYLHNDPPLPEELTNAIGEMLDHLDDVRRALPRVIDEPLAVVTGDEVRAIAAVEIGAAPDTAMFELTRDAAEDVFRTVATEAASQRALNPGLAPSCVDTVVAGCCALVAIMRSLHLAFVTVDIQSTVGGR